MVDCIFSDVGHGVRCGVQSQVWQRSAQCCQEENQRGPHHRGRPSPPQVQNVGPHGRLHLLRRGPARPGQDRGPERPVFPEEQRTLCHLHQGQLYRLHRGARGRVRRGGEEDAGGEDETPGASNSGTLRERSCSRGGHLQTSSKSLIINHIFFFHLKIVVLHFTSQYMLLPTNHNIFISFFLQKK